MKLNAYLDMKGRAQEAIEFYKQALGAEVAVLMRFKDMPAQDDKNCEMSPEMEQKVMHATLNIGDSVLMISDSPEPDSGAAEFKGITLSIGTDDMAAAEKMFHALAKEGKVEMPLARTFWAKAFGMVNDKFGVSWMVNVAEV